MADFCKQCSEDLFDGDCGDLEGLCQPGEIVHVICEGCGHTTVDNTGQCVSMTCIYQHAKDLPEQTEEKTS